MSPQQEQFCREYLVDLNATQAAIRAGYSEKTAGAQGHDILKRPEVQARVKALLEERFKRIEVTGDRILSEMANVAFLDPGEIATVEACQSPADLAHLPEHMRRAVAGWSWAKDGRFVVKLHDKMKALDMLARHKGLFEADNSQPADAFGRAIDQLLRGKGGSYPMNHEDRPMNEDRDE